MKKIYLFSALVLAAFVSCQTVEKENPYGPETAQVPMTFSATISLDEELENADASKLEVGTVDTENKKLTFAWKKGDRIAVYDNISATPNVFTADADGAKTSFSGTVSEGATRFIAIYPYSAAISANVETGACEIDFPREQTAVAGSFDPEALVSVGSAEITGETPNPSIRFRLIGALLSFSVDYDNVVYAEFSGSRPMTGRTTFNNAVGASGPSSVGTGTPNYKDVSLKAEEGSAFVKGETYYVSVRHTGSNSQEGFTAKLVTSNAQVASRTGSSALQIARKTLYPLGRFSDANVTFAYDRYAAYNAGIDVSIAGRTYNKATDGDAVEIPSGSTIQSKIVSGTKLYFLKPGTDYTINGYSFGSDVVIATENPDVRINVTPSSTFKFLSGSVVFSGIDFKLTALTSNAFCSNNGATGHYDRVALENCIFNTGTTQPKYFYQSSSNNKGYGISEIYVDGCLIPTSGGFTALFTTSSDAEYAPAASRLSSFTFTNNVLYSTTGGNVKFQVFGYTGSLDSSWEGTALVMNNNLFYNTYTSSGNFRSYNLSSADINNNILFATDGIDPGGNVKLLSLTVSNPDTYTNYSTAENNFYWGTLEGSRNWSLADSKHRGANMKNVSACTENPLAAQTDLATGTFVLTEAYSAYGPQPMPAPAGTPE